MTRHVKLPPRSSLRIPGIGRFLLKPALDSIEANRPDLFRPESAYRLFVIVPGKLWLARLRPGLDTN